MAIETPTINKIIRMTEFDLLRTTITPGNMYMCLDSQKLYYDQTASERVLYFYQGVKTINDLFHNITPAMNTTYYCWEDNSLWLWMNKWLTLWSDKTYPSAYVYDIDNTINPVYRYDQPLLPADDNGLLHDGSVVIRDRQRIIKGKIFIDDGNDNLVIGSFLGGGVRILPNGQMDTDGEFFIGDDGISGIRSSLHILNNEEYVDYSENPHLDPSPFPNPEHRYMVFHEGNIDVSLIREITPLEIYTKLLDNTLPNPFNFNVNKLGGHFASDYTLVGHTHITDDITNFDEQARAQALIEVRTVLNEMTEEGISLTYNDTTQKFNISANSFNLTFVGGVTGTAAISHLSNSTARLTVDPSMHIHQDYLDTMEDLQDQIDAIVIFDPEDYYNKEEVDELIDEVRPTLLPEIGKAVAVNNDGKISVTASSADKLASAIDVLFIGDITGSIHTDFNSNISINLSADNIISTVPVSGKALKIDSNGNLPGNALTSSALNHLIAVTLTGEVSGTASLDTSEDTFSISATLNLPDRVLVEDDLGITVASLGQDGKVPASQLPDEKITLLPIDVWNPESGAPSLTPSEGQFWISNANGIFNSQYYQVNDWCLYLNSAWNHISTNPNVLSVNGKTGIVILNPADIGAINTDLINYELGETIPLGKIVRTNEDGAIAGASIRKLTTAFNLLSDSLGDIEFGTESINTATDGTSDLDVKMIITNSGYANILANTGLVLFSDGTELDRKPQLNFGAGLSVSTTGSNQYTLTASAINNDYVLLYYDPDNGAQFIADLENNYDNRIYNPILVGAMSSNGTPLLYLIDSNAPDRSAGTTVSLIPIGYGSDNPTGGDLLYYQPVLESGTISITAYKYLFNITFADNESAVITNIAINTQSRSNPGYLSTDRIEGNITPYIPNEPYNPATKAYVDQSISYLNSADYIIIDMGKYTSETLATTINALFDNRSDKPIMIVNMSDYFSNGRKHGDIYIIDRSIVSRKTSDIIELQSTTTDDKINTAGSYDTVLLARNCLTIEFDSSSNIVNIADLGIPWVVDFSFLTPETTAEDAAFMAINDADPVSKGYLNTTLTNRIYTTTISGNMTSFTINHNLNSSLLLVQFRDITTGKQVYLENTIVNTNTITVESGSPITDTQIAVIIQKLES